MKRKLIFTSSEEDEDADKGVMSKPMRRQTPARPTMTGMTLEAISQSTNTKGASVSEIKCYISSHYPGTDPNAIGRRLKSTLDKLVEQGDISKEDTFFKMADSPAGKSIVRKRSAKAPGQQSSSWKSKEAEAHKKPPSKKKTMKVVKAASSKSSCSQTAATGRKIYSSSSTCSNSSFNSEDSDSFDSSEDDSSESESCSESSDSSGSSSYDSSDSSESSDSGSTGSSDCSTSGSTGSSESSTSGSTDSTLYSDTYSGSTSSGSDPRSRLMKPSLSKAGGGKVSKRPPGKISDKKTCSGKAAPKKLSKTLLPKKKKSVATGLTKKSNKAAASERRKLGEDTETLGSKRKTETKSKRSAAATGMANKSDKSTSTKRSLKKEASQREPKKRPRFMSSDDDEHKPKKMKR